MKLHLAKLNETSEPVLYVCVEKDEDGDITIRYDEIKVAFIHNLNGSIVPFVLTSSERNALSLKGVQIAEGGTIEIES